MSINRYSTPCGFTIIELLVALTLAAMLVLTVVGVVGRLAASQRIVTDADDEPTWLTALQDQLRTDFANARRFDLKPDELTIWGHGGRRYPDARITLRPAVIRYAIVTEQERGWMMREERLLDEPSARKYRNIVCRGIIGFRFIHPDGREATEESGTISRPLTIRFVSDSPDLSHSQLVIMP